MQDSALASSLASWPSKIEDLLEDQDSGERLVYELIDLLLPLMPLSDVFRSRLEAPVARGTDGVVDFAIINVPASRHEADYRALFEDPEVESAILLLMVITTGSLAEARIFDAELDLLMEQLQTCLQDWSCQVVPPDFLQQPVLFEGARSGLILALSPPTVIVLYSNETGERSIIIDTRAALDGLHGDGVFRPRHWLFEEQ